MATSVTLSTSKTTKPLETPSYQQAYDMSKDWLARTVQAGQDTASKQASTKDYYTAQDQARQSVYQGLNNAQVTAANTKSTFQDSVDYSKAALSAGGNTVSFTSGKKPSEFDSQMKMMEANKYAQQEQDLLNSAYRANEQARGHTNQVQLNAQQGGQEKAMLDAQNQFAASESEKQRQLQAYLGNVDANSRMASSLYSSFSQGNALDYRYW